jgi:hypothetical protein
MVIEGDDGYTATAQLEFGEHQISPPSGRCL